MIKSFHIVFKLSLRHDRSPTSRQMQNVSIRFLSLRLIGEILSAEIKYCNNHFARNIAIARK